MFVIGNKAQLLAIDRFYCEYVRSYDTLWNLGVVGGPVQLPKENTYFFGIGRAVPFWSLVWYRQVVRAGPSCGFGYEPQRDDIRVGLWNEQYESILEWTAMSIWKSTHWEPTAQQVLDPLFYNMYADYLDEHGNGLPDGFRSASRLLKKVLNGDFTKKRVPFVPVCK